MTQPTDDLAAQMVREMLGGSPGSQRLYAIARRYMEKLFVIASDYWGFVTDEDSFAADMRVNKIRAERAGKAER